MRQSRPPVLPCPSPSPQVLPPPSLVALQSQVCTNSHIPFPLWLLLFPSLPLIFMLTLYTAELVTTFAGHISESIEKAGSKDGKGPNASFGYPYGICINPHDGCMYVCDEEELSIRRVTMQGIHELVLLFILCLLLIDHNSCRFCYYAQGFW